MEHDYYRCAGCGRWLRPEECWRFGERISHRTPEGEECGPVFIDRVDIEARQPKEAKR